MKKYGFHYESELFMNLRRNHDKNYTVKKCKIEFSLSSFISQHNSIYYWTYRWCRTKYRRKYEHCSVKVEGLADLKMDRKKGGFCNL